MPSLSSQFFLEKTSGSARAARLMLKRATIETPMFMPVGTRASVKTLWQHELEEIDYPVILANTYHLLVRPGPELIEQMGGLHQFMGWDRPILTDSGGFQIFSLAGLRKINEEGATFHSHLDGKRFTIRPEDSMAIQASLGSDLVMAFDDCPALPCEKARLREAVERTLSWAKRCLHSPLGEEQQLLGIIQGGLDLTIRSECLERLNELGLDACAIGGLSVGEKNDQMQDLLEGLCPKMSADKPRYLMGVGRPQNILEAVARGVDLFDCVLPTRNARNGQALVTGGALNMKNKRFEKDPRPLEVSCACRVCQRYSRAYIRHLITTGEYLGAQMLSYHNLYWMRQFMREIRVSIVENRFDEYRHDFYTNVRCFNENPNS